MKILYITHDYGERWIKYADFLRELGHEVDLIILKDKRTPGQVTVESFKEGYDIVWAFAADYIWYKVMTDEFVDAVKSSKSVFIGYCTMNTVFPFKEWVQNFKAYDFCFLHSKLVTQMAEAEGLTNVMYMPYGFDKDEYFKIKKRKKYNISFAGSTQTNFPPEEDDRIKIVKALAPFKIYILGIKFKPHAIKGVKVVNLKDHKHMNKVFNQSCINLNVGLLNSKLPELINKCHPKNRFYEIPGSGNFMLSTYCDEYNEQFQDKVHCGYYNTIDDICEKVEYYLTHEKEREEIALAGYEHAVKNHQTIFRFERMMEIIKERFF